MDTKNTLKVFDTAEALSVGVAECIIDKAKKAIEANDRFVIALSGGRTPEMVFTLLAQPGYIDKIDWTKTHIFWGDERCVPLDDVRNNAHTAMTLLLNKIEVPTNVYTVPTNLTPEDAAQVYEDTIKNLFGNALPAFDLIMLGLGENGHTASLFPHTDVLHEKTRLVKEVFVEEVDMYRITMTAPMINMARAIMFIVSGTSKAEVVKTVLHGAYEPDMYPAQLIKPVKGKLYWYIDSAAAAHLG